MGLNVHAAAADILSMCHRRRAHTTAAGCKMNKKKSKQILCITQAPKPQIESGTFCDRK
jgi:hypothetical protein